MRQRLDKANWEKLRISLNKNYVHNDNWEKVIKLFQQRLDDFYFTPIDELLRLSKQGEGFSILTLQCALIEMFAAFRKGKIHNRNKPKTGGFKYEYNDSGNCFIEFLHTEEIFRDNFYRIDKNGVTQKNQPFNGTKFYSNVRCGLMHEARTKKDWLITAANRTEFTDKIFIAENKADKTKSINRTILQQRLKTFFKDVYIVELNEKNNRGEKLRRLLARKLDHLYDIPRDIKYDWWLDK